MQENERREENLQRKRAEVTAHTVRQIRMEQAITTRMLRSPLSIWVKEADNRSKLKRFADTTDRYST